MILNKINTYKEYESLLAQYSLHSLFSNDYMQAEVASLIAHDALYEYHTSLNLFFIVRRDQGMRVYYYLGNLDEVVDFSDCQDIMMEILYRGPKSYPQIEIDYFQKCGFKINLVRDLYCGMYKDLSKPIKAADVIVREAETLEDIAAACELFNQVFDPLSGDFIVKTRYERLLAESQILIAQDPDNQFLGALHQTIDKGVAWISHVAVMPEARGKHVGRALLDTFVWRNANSEKQRYMFWVQNQNTVAVSMYKKKGFKYLNKSTISLFVE